MSSPLNGRNTAVFDVLRRSILSFRQPSFQVGGLVTRISRRGAESATLSPLFVCALARAIAGSKAKNKHLIRLASLLMRIRSAYLDTILRQMFRSSSV